MPEICNGPEPWHGTVGGYTNHGCRGPQCAAAYGEYSRRQARRRQATANPPARIHGTVGGYTNWGCRCPECSTAMQKYQEAKRARR